MLPAMDYQASGYLGTVPGADWIIDGQVWHEMSRTSGPDGCEYVHMIRKM